MDSVVQGVIQECDLLTQTSSDHLPSIVDKYFSSLRSVYPGSILDRHAPVKEFARTVPSFTPSWYASLMKFPLRSELGDDFNENGIVLRELKTTIVTPIVNGMIADAKERHYLHFYDNCYPNVRIEVDCIFLFLINNNDKM